MDYKAILDSSKLIAIVGCSPDRIRTSNRIARYLIDNGFEIIPVNPNTDSVLGIPAYPSIADIPTNKPIDIVNIFRKPKHTLGIVQEVIDYSDRYGVTPVVWTQLGVSSKEAEVLAKSNNITYIANRCIMVEHAR